jgi:hypothetical protein
MDLPPFVPTPEDGLDLLSPVAPHLQPAMDNALFKTTTYVESENLECDGSTFLTFVRAHAKNYLVKQKMAGVEFKDWSLSGIEWRIGDAIFRSWKGVGHELPPPGLSVGRMRFLNQQYPLALDYSGVKKLRNFVVLYDIGPSNKITLWLVCPKKYDAEERIAEAWWWIQIPEPAAGMSGQTAIGTPPNDLEGIQAKIPQTKKKAG